MEIAKAALSCVPPDRRLVFPGPHFGLVNEFETSQGLTNPAEGFRHHHHQLDSEVGVGGHATRLERNATSSRCNRASPSSRVPSHGAGI